jgi:hypothetical protein
MTKSKDSLTLLFYSQPLKGPVRLHDMVLIVEEVN